jgi:hypothetical protein
MLELTPFLAIALPQLLNAQKTTGTDSPEYTEALKTCAYDAPSLTSFVGQLVACAVSFSLNLSLEQWKRSLRKG